MMKDRLAILAALTMVALLALNACGPTPEPQVVEQIITQQVEVTRIVEKLGKVVTVVETQIVEVPTLPLFQRVEVTGFAPDLKGWALGPSNSPTWNIHEWYFEGE
jgi:hypothetical protein